MKRGTRHVTSTRCVFPLRLAGQTIVMARALLVEPIQIRLHVVPRHTDHGMIAAAPTVIGWRKAVAAAAGQAGVPLLERHFVFADRERRDRNFVLRTLIAPATRFGCRRSHLIEPTRHHHHFWAARAVLNALPRIEGRR